MTPSPLYDAFAPVAVVDRSGVDESLHHGAVVVLGPDGELVFAAGDPDVAIYPRSSNKPMQARGMLDLGLDVDDEQLALACASHDGTERHVAVVRRILAAAGLGEEALGNTASLPLQQAAMEQLLAAGGHRAPILMNCSGKHAAMVATCRARDWPVDGYLAADHPLQQALTDRIAELAGPVLAVGVDGCGAPAHVLPLRSLALGFRTLAAARGRVWRAMTEHPELVAGDTRTATRVMRALPALSAPRTSPAGAARSSARSSQGGTCRLCTANHPPPEPSTWGAALRPSPRSRGTQGVRSRQRPATSAPG